MRTTRWRRVTNLDFYTLLLGHYCSIALTNVPSVRRQIRTVRQKGLLLERAAAAQVVELCWVMDFCSRPSGA